MADINRSFKAVEIIDQILRNRQGSLTRPQLKELADTAFTVGLKFLEFYLLLTSRLEEEILRAIKDIIRGDESIKDDNVAKEARKLYLALCYGASFAVIQKIANSVASDVLILIFEELVEDNQSSLLLDYLT
jgi:hypothetical protein